MIRAHYYEKYTFAFKHTDHVNLKEKMNKYKYHIFVDTSNYDQSRQSSVMDMALDQINWCHPALIKLAKMQLHAPYLAAGTSKKFTDPLWSYQPTRSESDQGLTSGIAFVADFGKLDNATLILIGLSRCAFDIGERQKTHYSEVETNEILTVGGTDVGVISFGDDNVICMNSESLYLEVLSRLRGYTFSKYLRCSIEEGAAIGGLSCVDKGDGIELYPNANTYLSGILSNEWGIDSFKRMFTWTIGFKNREETFYKRMPVFEDLRAMLFDKYLFYTGRQLQDEIELWERDVINWLSDKKDLESANILRALQSSDVLSDASLEVLLDGQKMHYKFQPEDVDPLVLQAVSGSIPPEDVMSYFYNGGAIL
jgi:hypothetical protein